MNRETDSGELAGSRAARWRPEGRYLYALGAAMLAIIWLESGDFINVWQPVSNNFPARKLFVEFSAIAMLVSSAGLLLRQTARIAAVAPTLLYLLFVWGWITRIMLLPTVFGTWSGCAEEVVLVIAGALLFAAGPRNQAPSNMVVTVSRIVFGLCAVSFGIIHFQALEPTAKMVPGWLPGSGNFWAMATGLCHAAGGVALIVNFRTRLAAYLLATMYLVFELLVWIPSAWPIHFDPVVWGGNAVTIAIAASAWVLGDMLGQRRASARDAISARSIAKPASQPI